MQEKLGTGTADRDRVYLANSLKEPLLAQNEQFKMTLPIKLRLCTDLVP